MGPEAGSGVTSGAEGGAGEAASPSALTTSEDIPIAPRYASGCGCTRCRNCTFFGAVQSCRGDK